SRAGDRHGRGPHGSQGTRRRPLAGRRVQPGIIWHFYQDHTRLQPDFNVRVVNRKLDMRQALDEVAQTFEAHDYAQYFWFPFNRDVTLQTSDVTGEPATWTRLHEW